MQTSSELLGRAFDRALNRWRREKSNPAEMLPGTPQARHWSIAISRESGAGGGTIARAVGTLLGWDVYDRELIDAIATKKNIRVELLDSVDEKQRHWLTECVAGLVGAETISSDRYALYLAETVLALGVHGDCVIVGRGAAALLPPERTLRVRLVAPLADRIRRTMNKFGMTRPEAERYVATTDKQRVEFVQARYHKEPALFDLTINTARLSTDQCAAVIKAALDAVRNQSSPASSGREVKP